MTASLKQKLRGGRPATGCRIEVVSPLAAEVFALTPAALGDSVGPN